MKLSQHLMNAETPEIYDLFRTELLAFVSETEQRHSHLFNWLEFYDQRRTGWSQAYRNAELPKSNKGESGKIDRFIFEVSNKLLHIFYR